MSKIEFASFENYFSDLHPHTLFYGFNGTGKTTFAGKTGMRMVLLDCGDSGVVTLRGVKNMRIVRIRSTNQYLDVIEELVRRSDQFDLLVPDTLTGLYSTAVKEVKGRRGTMNIKKWGTASSKVIECISETRNFPKDVIYLAQEKEKGKTLGDNDGPKFITPSLSPSIREYLSGCVDWVGRLYMDGETRKLSFILTDTVEAKDRGGIFPKIITLGGGPNKSAYPQIRQRIITSVGS